MESDDLTQIGDSLRHAVKVDGALAQRKAVEDFGWPQLLEEEPFAAVSTLFEIQGELLLDTSFLDEVLVQAGGDQLPTETRVVLPPPGALMPASRMTTDGVFVEGVVQAGSGALLVPCVDATGKLALVTALVPESEETPADTLDPASGWRLVRELTTDVDVCLDGGTAGEVWDRMTAAGRRALSHELVGIGTSMLDLTLDHVKTREQFGRPLGAFQTIKHRLADVRLWQECAGLAATTAWDDCSVDSAALAKALACRFTTTARIHCQQFLGGMGFTWEHPFHLYLRRALTIEPLLGGAAAQQDQLGKAIRQGVAPDAFAAL